MQKHAYMIIAHNEFDLLEILVRLLDDPRNDIYVHIDAKVKNFDFKTFQALTQYSRLRFTPRRISATWGDFSLVNTELLLLQTAVAGEDPAQPYAYYHLISGVDLPIKSNDDIHAFFEKNAGKEFVHFSENEPIRLLLQGFAIIICFVKSGISLPRYLHKLLFGCKFCFV